MKSSSREELWQRISADSVPVRPLPAATNIQSPWPGTLWVHPATAAFAVEWLVVAWGHQKPQSCLLVPADCRPILGAGDVSIPAEELGGPLSVRCHLGQWVPPTILDQAQASGQVATSALTLIRDRHLESANGDAADLLLGLDGGPSAAYEDWIADLRQAWVALRSTLPETEVAPSRFAPPWLAAVLVITLGAGSALYLGRQELLKLGQAPLDSISRQATSTGPPPSNLARIVMSTAVTRGAGPTDELLLPADAEHVLIYILLDGNSRYPSYRLHILDLISNHRVWSADDLRPIDDGAGFTLSTTVPKQVLIRPAAAEPTPDSASEFQGRSTPDPGFRVELEGLADSHWVPVTRHTVYPRIPPDETD